MERTDRKAGFQAMAKVTFLLDFLVRPTGKKTGVPVSSAQGLPSPLPEAIIGYRDDSWEIINTTNTEFWVPAPVDEEGNLIWEDKVAEPEPEPVEAGTPAETP